jgi:general secretion pathway protein C
LVATRYEAQSTSVLRYFRRNGVLAGAELFLIGLVIIQCVRLGSLVMQNVNIKPVQHDVLRTRTVDLSQADPFFRDSAAPNDSAIVTSLNVKLFGVRMSTGSEGNSAIIAGPDGVQNSVAVGEPVMPGVRLTAVFYDHAIVDNRGVNESVFLDQSVAPTVSAGRSKIGDGVKQPLGLSATMLQRDITVAPRLEGGTVTGLTLSPNGSGKGFALAGFKDGDVVTAINNRAITGAGDAQALLSELKPGALVNMTVERGAQTFPFTIMVAP